MPEAIVEKIQRTAGRLRRPSRFVNWLRARKERGRRPDRLGSFPLGIDLEPTTRCNLRCRACQRNDPHWTELDLPVGRFERILDQLPALEQIKLQGIGEPLLHERFFDLVRIASRRGVRVGSITNGTTLKREEHRRGIVESGMDEMLVSIDGATPETHGRWRGGSDLGPIVEGLGQLVSLRRSERWPRLGIWTVGNPDNLPELPALVDLAAKTGVDSLTYQTQMTGWGKQEWVARLHAARVEPENDETARRLAEALEYARRRGVALTIYGGNRFGADRPCFWPWESCFISASGQVTRCCIISDPRLHAFGRIDDTDFPALWNSAEYREFRRSIRENQIPPLCRPCYGMFEEPRANPGGQTLATP